MTRLIKASEEPSSLFNAFAIAFGIEVLSGRLDALSGKPNYKRLLEVFAQRHPAFDPPTWENLKNWFQFYNTPKELELLLFPVFNNLSGTNFKNLTEALEVDVHYVGEACRYFYKNNVNICLENENCVVYARDEDINKFIALYDKPFIDSDISIPAPNGAFRKLPPKKTIVEIDNPGGGDCAFYAFAIGLVRSIQEEAREGKKAIFEKWVSIDPTIAPFYKDLCDYNFKRSNSGDKLLETLQTSMRLVCYTKQVDEVQAACASVMARIEQDGKGVLTADENSYKEVESNSVFLKFSGIINKTERDKNFNPLLSNSKIKKEIEELDNVIAVAESENPKDKLLASRMILEKFIELCQQKNSPIIKALDRVKQPHFWGTHLDLDHIARAFSVDFHYYRNGIATQEFRDKEIFSISVNNKGNNHWTSFVPFTDEELNKFQIKPVSNKRQTQPASGPRVAPVDDRLTKSARKASSDPTPKDTPVGSSVTYKQPRVQPPVVVKPAPVLIPKKSEPKANAPIRKQVIENSTEKNDTLSLALRTAVTDATKEYITYSNNIWFSFFHRHGSTGRNRASAFQARFCKEMPLEEARMMLRDFLLDPTNGNTHPHSFRTMLLNKLLGGDNSDNKKLQDVSDNFYQKRRDLIDSYGLTFSKSGPSV